MHILICYHLYRQVWFVKLINFPVFIMYVKLTILVCPYDSTNFMVPVSAPSPIVLFFKMLCRLHQFLISICAHFYYMICLHIPYTSSHDNKSKFHTFSSNVFSFSKNIFLMTTLPQPGSTWLWLPWSQPFFLSLFPRWNCITSLHHLITYLFILQNILVLYYITYGYYDPAWSLL